jgi:CO/xanthine dehydrogenase Mo-binding subunit
MVVGELLRRASIKLRQVWADGLQQTIEERYKQPDFVIPFDLEKFSGDAYPTYSWAVGAVEVELDTVTGTVEVLGAYGCFDVGTPIDRRIVTGQMEGGLLQAVGYASMEQMAVDGRGRIRNNSYSDYMIPTALDVPVLKCMLYEEQYPEGPYGAKGAGELPAVCAAAAYLEAVEQALGGARLSHIPFSAEDAMEFIAKS